MLDSDPMLPFPESDLDDNKSSGFCEVLERDSELSELLSASEVETLFSSVGHNVPQQLLSGKGLSSLTQVESDEDYCSETETVSPVFTCNVHKEQFNNVSDFETHQIDHHTVGGRFACGLCPKDYSSKYQRHNHFTKKHLGVRFRCGFAGCGKIFLQKRYRDSHESRHNIDTGETTQEVKFCCERCDEIFTSLALLKMHKLTHSKTKKFPCRVCKQHGYTRAHDRNNHEVKCCDDHRVEIIDGVVVPLPDLTKEKVTADIFPKEPKSNSRKTTARKNLFPLESDVTPKKSNDKSIEVIFLSDSENGNKSPRTRKSLDRSCKNGVKPGFYKNGCSPKRTPSETSTTSRLSSPKASVRGQHKCSECKQHFRLRGRLLEHIEQYHTTAKIQYTCAICKVALDDKKSFDVHKKQHDMDSKRSKGKLRK